jgi:hypothetical protein
MHDAVNGFLHKLISVNFTKIFLNYISFPSIGISKVLKFVSVSFQIIFAKFMKEHQMFAIKNQKPTATLE